MRPTSRDTRRPSARSAARVLVAAGLASLALAACGSDTGSGGGGTSSTGATAPLTATSSSPAATTSSGVTSPPPSPSTAPAPSSAPSSTTTPVPAPSSPAAVQGAGSRLPVYVVAQDGDGQGESGGAAPRLRLFREYLAVPAGAAAGTPQDQAATRAVAAAMTAVPAGYQRLWGERSVQKVARTASGITITLAPGGAPALDAAKARAAVDSLVWTATAAYGADVPVRLESADGSPVATGIPSGTVRRRAPQGQDGAVLAGIWIDSPAIGQTVPAGRVRATGQASVFEGTVVWSLTKDGAGVARGVATAGAAAPARGSWSADLGTLTPGRYQLTASADSPAGKGGVLSRVVHAFTVG